MPFYLWTWSSVDTEYILGREHVTVLYWKGWVSGWSLFISLGYTAVIQSYNTCYDLWRYKWMCLAEFTLEFHLATSPENSWKHWIFLLYPYCLRHGIGKVTGSSIYLIPWQGPSRRKVTRKSPSISLDIWTVLCRELEVSIHREVICQRNFVKLFWKEESNMGGKNSQSMMTRHRAVLIMPVSTTNLLSTLLLISQERFRKSTSSD